MTDLFGNPIRDESPHAAPKLLPPPPITETIWWWGLRENQWTPGQVIKEGLTTTIWK
jgi:hypothetical protein